MEIGSISGLHSVACIKVLLSLLISKYDYIPVLYFDYLEIDRQVGCKIYLRYFKFMDCMFIFIHELLLLLYTIYDSQKSIKI